MPRPPRADLPHVPLHIIQRGNNRSACFSDADDFHTYLYWLERCLHRTRCRLHAYVLMTNHVHLLVTPTVQNGASRLMQVLGQRYVRYFNDIHGRTGTLWEGRFRASPVHARRYLVLCMRYIELNPLRAGIVQDPADYRWSSFRANALGAPASILSPHPIYCSLGLDAEARSRRYRELFEDAIEEAAIARIRSATQGGHMLANDGIRRRVERMTGRRLAPGTRGRRPQAPAPLAQSDSESPADRVRVAGDA